MMGIHSPYDMQRHPIFQFDARRVTWIQSPQRLRAVRTNALVRAHGLVLVAWLGLIGLAAIVNWGNFDGDAVLAASLVSVNVIVMIGIGAGTILDFLSLQAALKSISGEKTAGRWDLLRLTALHEWGMVRAKHAAIRLRIWRFTTFLTQMRLATITLSLFTILVVPYLALGENTIWAGLMETMTDAPVSFVLFIITSFIALIIYVIEPYWRMQAMTALGMVLSAYIENVPMATMAAVGAMFAVWLAQTAIILALVTGLTFGSSVALAPLFIANSGALYPVFIYLLLACLATAATIYGFYALLQTWSLRRVRQRIDKGN
jgi:hypothetical protein